MSERVIAVTNQKGGVGKTTTTVNLGAALAAAGKKVLVIDYDPQGSLTASFGYTPAEQKRTINHLMLSAIDCPEDLELHIERTIIKTDAGIDLIPCNKRVADAAARLQVMQLSQYNAMGAADGRACEKVLAAITNTLRCRYDYIIIDCGLKYELLTVNALSAADYCIIPVQAHFLASEGIPEVLELVRSVRAKFNPALKIAGILITMYQSRPQLCENIRESVVDVYGTEINVFPHPIEYSIKLAEAPATGQSILVYRPRNPAAVSYRHLAEEVLKLG